MLQWSPKILHTYPIAYLDCFHTFTDEAYMTHVRAYNGGKVQHATYISASICLASTHQHLHLYLPYSHHRIACKALLLLLSCRVVVFFASHWCQTINTHVILRVKPGENSSITATEARESRSST